MSVCMCAHVTGWYIETHFCGTAAMMRRRVGSKRCRLPYKHTHTHSGMLTHRAEPSFLLYYRGQLVSKWKYGKERKNGEEKEMNSLWLLWWTQLFNTALLFFNALLFSPFVSFTFLFVFPLFFLVHVCAYYITPTSKPIYKTSKTMNVKRWAESKHWGKRKHEEKEEQRDGKAQTDWNEKME